MTIKQENIGTLGGKWLTSQTRALENTMLLSPRWFHFTLNKKLPSKLSAFFRPSERDSKAPRKESGSRQNLLPAACCPSCSGHFFFGGKVSHDLKSKRIDNNFYFFLIISNFSRTTKKKKHTFFLNSAQTYNSQNGICQLHHHNRLLSASLASLTAESELI